MASIRNRPRAGGGTTYAVLYTLDGKQTSVPYTTLAEAEDFRDLINRVGPHRAMEIEGIPPPRSAAPKCPYTVAQWCEHHIASLGAVEQTTIDAYDLVLRSHIKPIIGDIPLTKLTHEDVTQWMAAMAATKSKRTGRPPSVSAVKSAHSFLSGALAKAVPKYLPGNPAVGQRMPKASIDDDITERMLSRDEFDRLLACVTDPWKPLVEFLVCSGCRWGEAVALKPGDVDRKAGTVRIRRAWKHSRTAGYLLGAPKTEGSRRTINVPKWMLDKLDYSSEWLFTNRNGGPVRYHTFLSGVWRPAVKRSGLQPPPRIHHLRHTYASWLLNIGVPINVVSRQLGHGGIQMTVDVYGHVDRRSFEDAAAVMGELLARPAQRAIEGPKTVE